MHFVRLGLISIIVLALLVTGISLFISPDIRIVRSVFVRASKDSIMAKIRNAREWRSWYPGMDSAKAYLAGGEVKGYILDETDPAHPAILQITAVKPGEVTAQLTSSDMRPVINGWTITESTNKGTFIVQWYMSIHLHWYPWEKFGSLVWEKNYGTPMDRGLNTLKNQVENN
jgi:hypothetical protein